MTQMRDEDILLNEARRICSNLEGKVSADQLRRQFAFALSKGDPRRRSTHAAFQHAVERAKASHALSQDEDGNFRLREL